MDLLSTYLYFRTFFQNLLMLLKNNPVTIGLKFHYYVDLLLALLILNNLSIISSSPDVSEGLEVDL